MILISFFFRSNFNKDFCFEFLCLHIKNIQAKNRIDKKDGLAEIDFLYNRHIGSM